MITERDKRADVNENKTMYSRDKKTSDEAQRFLSEGLDRTFVSYFTVRYFFLFSFVLNFH